MSKIIGGPVTQEERSATKAVDLWKGMDCKGFDPEKSDHIHGRAGAPSLMFDRMKGVKVFGCEACVFGDRYEHTCGAAIEARVVARHGRRRKLMALRQDTILNIRRELCGEVHPC